MSDWRDENARVAGRAADAVSNSIVVVGGGDSADTWRDVLGMNAHQSGAGSLLQERGRKGNFLGALQAFRRVRGGPNAEGLSAVEQIVMFVGTGSRLSPITQALQNMKAALPLPSGREPSGTVTVGEAAVRSSAPWISSLRAAGFDGVLIRWGDEIMIPSTSLDFGAGQFSDVDAVRFGYNARPTDLLATQKEWLLTDERANVYAELPRQSLERLLDQVSRYRSVRALHVNLGSFAISFALLRSLESAFGDLIDEDGPAANWDPYLWMALHSSARSEWEADCRAGRTEVPRDFAELVEAIPDFWRRVQDAKAHLLEHTGRTFTARVLDFGEPYWFDAGNHAALRAGLGDIFSSGEDGATLREFLALPPDLVSGASFILNSTVESPDHVKNSIVVGSTISGPDSYAERSIIIGSRLGQLRADPGAVVIECDGDQLSVDGPEGFAVRIVGRAHVRGDEITASVSTNDGSMRLSHFGPSTIVDHERFSTRQWSNPISFEAASQLVNEATQN